MAVVTLNDLDRRLTDIAHDGIVGLSAPIDYPDNQNPADDFHTIVAAKIIRNIIFKYLARDAQNLNLTIEESLQEAGSGEPGAIAAIIHQQYYEACKTEDGKVVVRNAVKEARIAFMQLLENIGGPISEWEMGEADVELLIPNPFSTTEDSDQDTLDAAIADSLQDDSAPSEEDVRSAIADGIATFLEQDDDEPINRMKPNTLLSVIHDMNPALIVRRVHSLLVELEEEQEHPQFVSEADSAFAIDDATGNHADDRPLQWPPMTDDAGNRSIPQTVVDENAGNRTDDLHLQWPPMTDDAGNRSIPQTVVDENAGNRTDDLHLQWPPMTDDAGNLLDSGEDGEDGEDGEGGERRAA